MYELVSWSHNVFWRKSWSQFFFNYRAITLQKYFDLKGFWTILLNFSFLSKNSDDLYLMLYVIKYSCNLCREVSLNLLFVYYVTGFSQIMCLTCLIVLLLLELCSFYNGHSRYNIDQLKLYYVSNTRLRSFNI